MRFLKKQSTKEIAAELRALRKKRLREEGYNKLKSLQHKEKRRLNDAKLSRIGLDSKKRKKYADAFSKEIKAFTKKPKRRKPKKSGLFDFL